MTVFDVVREWLPDDLARIVVSYVIREDWTRGYTMMLNSFIHIEGNNLLPEPGEIMWVVSYANEMERPMWQYE